MRRKRQPGTAGGYNGNGYTLLNRIAIRDYVFSVRIWFLYRKELCLLSGLAVEKFLCYLKHNRNAYTKKRYS
jgi:hypothetical protein